MSPPIMVDPFEQWWRLYPRRVAKIAARRAWAKAVRSGEVSEARLLETIGPFAAAVAHKDAQFVPHPATYLNGGRWDDDLAAYAPALPAVTYGAQAQDDAAAAFRAAAGLNRIEGENHGRPAMDRALRNGEAAIVVAFPVRPGEKR